MPDGSTWKLRFSTDQQFRKYRNYRICLLLFRDKSKGKKSQSPEKKEATENREDKHSKNQQKSKSPQISQGSVWRVLPSNLVRLLQATHAVPPGQGKGAFYSPLPADPAARARAQSRVMSPGLLMLPRQAPCCTPTSAFPASCRRASELHFFRRWTLFDGF